MKQIYFVLTNTGTALSKIVRFFMKDEYAHVSVALDKDLKRMYSFGRLNPYNPFYGGFVHEGIRKRTFRRFKKTKSTIVSLDITDQQYKKLEELIQDIKKERRNYGFNVKGLFAIYFNKKIRKEKSFYCAEFVKYLIEEAGIELELPELVRPEHFKKISKCKLIYKGLLNNYN